MPHPVDLSSLSRGAREAIRAAASQQFVSDLTAAMLRQRQVAARNHTRPPRGVDKLASAEQVAAIDPVLHNLHRVQFGDVADSDPDFTTWLTKNHAEFRVKSTGTRAQVGYSIRSPRSGKRVSFFKVYA